jgi:glycosyltransferase involved in cell wall biosynthesis
MGFKFSIVIPARNEERLIGRCLESIRLAAAAFAGEVEIIVVLNRCTDRTEEIAHSFGARTIREDARNLSRIRNAGARIATGKVLVTIDADSAMTPNMLTAIDRALSSGKTVGGGTFIRPDRLSVGIVSTMLFLGLYLLLNPVSGGLFWCYREDFETIGGFDENLVSGEDIQFARRLKAYGKKVKRPFRTLLQAYILTSCRKLDEFGDWYILRHPMVSWRIVNGKSPRDADWFFYDFKR